MSLAFLPRRRAVPVTPHRFRLLDEVRICGEAGVGRVVGLRAPKPHLPEVLVERADGSLAWLSERAVRGSAPRLAVVDGGRP